MARIHPAFGCVVAALAASSVLAPDSALAQSAIGSSFTYQGEVRDGDALANGTYDLAFTLYNDSVPLASPVCFDNVDVVDGRFTVELDFGAAFTGQRRYVEIAIRADSTAGNCSVPTNYTVLSPRQEVTALPYALSSVNAANAALLAGSPASFFTNASNLTSGTLPTARLSSAVPILSNSQTFSGANVFNNPANVFVGSGAGLTSLDAANITSGTLSSLRLASNVARLDAAQNWTSPQNMSSAGNVFAGSGSLLTALNASAISSGTLNAARLPSTVLQSNVPAAIVADYRFASMSLNTTVDASADFRIAAVRSYGINATQASTSSNAAAIRGEATATTGSVYGGYFSSSSTQGAALAGSSAVGTAIWGRATGADGVGVYGSASTAGAEAMKAINFSGDPGAFALKAQAYTTNGAAVYAEGLGATGNSHGLWGVSLSPNGFGVLAANSAADGTALQAVNTTVSGHARAIYASVNGDNATTIDALQSSTAPTGTQIALKASTYSTSPDAWAAWFNGRVYMNSQVLLGYGTPEAMLHISRSSSTHPTPLRIDVDGDPKFIVAQQGATGIGTANPNARLHVNGAPGESAFRVSVDGATKLNIRDNGGTVIGGLGATPPADGLLVNHQIILRDSDANRGNDLWIGPAYDFETAHVVVNGDGQEDLLTLSNQDATKFRVHADGSTSVGTNSVPPSQGMYILGNVVVGATFPLPSQKLYVNGSAEVNGNLAKAGGSFKIDHPLDPTNKYLYHSFVESPDMMNIYNGNVVTDTEGFATVDLPDWFDALNSDFRYQLTVIDSGDDDLVFARIYRKVENNRFVIKTSRPTTEVSWQVTGIRKDPWAQKNRIPVEEPKDEAHKGTYLHPEVYGHVGGKEEAPRPSVP